MEHAKGLELRTLWFDLDVDVQISYIHEIMKHVQKTSQLTFPAYGSLYFRNRVIPLGIEQIPLDAEFCLGPHCGRMY